MKYWAFISYSSKDSSWAKWLHKKLENYIIPKDICQNKFSDGTSIPTKLRPIFRDLDELPSTANLGDKICDSLSQSRYLIVLCSHNAIQSRWVNEEIRFFKSLNGSNKILPVIVGRDHKSADIDKECFPEALRQLSEPLASDLRKLGDGKQRGLIKIIAGLIEQDFDKLYRRHERRTKFRWLIVTSVLVSLTVSFAGIARFAVRQKNLAEQNELNAKKQATRAEKNYESAYYALLETFHNVVFEFQSMEGMYLKTQLSVLKTIEDIIANLEKRTSATEKNVSWDATETLQLEISAHLAEIYFKLGQIEEVEKRAINILIKADEMINVYPNPTRRTPAIYAAASAHRLLGDIAFRNNKISTSLTHYHKAKGLREQEFANLVGGYYKAVEKILRENMATQGNDRVFMGQLPSHFTYQFLTTLAGDFERLGITTLLNKEPKMAIEYFEKGLTYNNYLKDKYPENSKWFANNALEIIYIGDCYLELKQPNKAKDNFDKATDELQILYAKYPNNITYKSYLTIGLERQGNLLMENGKFQKAVSIFTEILSLKKQLQGVRPTEYGKDIDIITNKLKVAKQFSKKYNQIQTR